MFAAVGRIYHRHCCWLLVGRIAAAGSEPEEIVKVAPSMSWVSTVSFSATAISSPTEIVWGHVNDVQSAGEIADALSLSVLLHENL